MYTVKATNRFKKDLKTIMKRGYNTKIIDIVISELSNGRQLAEKYNEKGEFCMKNIKKVGVLLITACSIFAAAAFSGIAHASKITSVNQAKNKALKEVKNAVVLEVDTDHDNGVLVYDVDLLKGKKKYNIIYRASDGKKIEYGWEIQDYYAKNSNIISKIRCQKLALNKVKNAEVISIVDKTDDGMRVYKVKLKKENKSYTLEYHASTGKLMEYEWEIISQAANSSSNNNGYIEENKAKSIALEKVPGARVVKIEFDTDDGKEVYEVELVDASFEYEIKIDATTGQIIEFDQDDLD